mmetsp:Transcript_27808/g.51416  ORF Transcript_27808/g.51416 Transcript_27808/m.51416 type:complete len:112 (+) Transcript_27808:162-497(+)
MKGLCRLFAIAITPPLVAGGKAMKCGTASRFITDSSAVHSSMPGDVMSDAEGVRAWLGAGRRGGGTGEEGIGTRGVNDCGSEGIGAEEGGVGAEEEGGRRGGGAARGENEE